MNQSIEAISKNDDKYKVTWRNPAPDLHFEPIRFRPIPGKVNGLTNHILSLNGNWRINPNPPEGFRKQTLDSSGWGDFKVPGQWVQQGYDLPQDKPVAVAKAFTIPKQWAGYRIFLRFDAIHAGTRYWLNGKELGYSENLFTPVEWEITESVRPGENNRLDLEMMVDTPSEKLSHSCGYAFHNLGGIDRSVRLYALPQVNIKHIYLAADLDEAYRDGLLALRITLENNQKVTNQNLELQISLYEPDGKQITHSAPKYTVNELSPGTEEIEIISYVVQPTQWNAEKPFLYKLVIKLTQNGAALESIERNIGFRKVEIKGKQLYINGQRVKLHGACRHEIDPLTGRADTMRYAEGDVKLLKGASINNIRTAHYPPTMELVEAADRLGAYVELEAPFCWVEKSDELHYAKEVLTVTSAMVDYYYANPSVIIWSLANESALNQEFELSNAMCKELDPSRVTVFHHDFRPEPKQICDLLCLHYPPMPYEENEEVQKDTRPYLIGEYFPLVQSLIGPDINPGIGELLGHGYTDPESNWGKRCAAVYDTELLWGARPGAWSYIYHSDRIVGGDIWAAIDEPFYLPGGKRAGYAFHFGKWGLLDAWRRTKPEWWLSKLIFSPVWFPKRHLDFFPGQEFIRVPVENRYSFTNLNELNIAWECNGITGQVTSDIAPLSTGELELPLPKGIQEGDKVVLRLTDAQGELVNTLAIHLGREKIKPLPEPTAGAPKWTDDEKQIRVNGDKYSFVLNRTTGDFDVNDSEHHAPITHFPSLHVARYDYSELFGEKPPYSEFPDINTRNVASVTLKEVGPALEIVIRDSYEGFEGTIRWLIDKDGMGKVVYDYTYSGEDLEVRETGINFQLTPQCDEVKWRRWSEWDIYPEDSISRTEGNAKARRGNQQGRDPEEIKPTWEWRLDQTELGTNDFRSVKLNIYEASLAAPDGSSICVYAKADAHVRPALSSQGVNLHVLSQYLLGPLTIKSGDKITGEFVVQILK